jgi:hypothetical protein
MATRAQQIYYEAFTSKQNRDARNPILEAAQSGWASGLDRGLKSKQENDDNLKKGMLKGSLDKQEARIKLADKIIETYSIKKDGVIDNSIEAKKIVHSALVAGDNSFPKGYTVEPMKNPLQDAQINNLNANAEYTNWARGEGKTKSGNNPTMPKDNPDENLFADTPAPAPIIPTNNKPGFIAGVRDGLLGRKQPAPVAPVQSPALPEEKVKEIGNAALKAHYKHTAVNPKTGAKVYSDDGLTWFDENGKPIQ